MLHPDYQYSPKLVTAMPSPVAIGQFDLVLGSRIVCEGALQGGMLGCLWTAVRFRLARWGLLRSRLFPSRAN